MRRGLSLLVVLSVTAVLTTYIYRNINRNWVDYHNAGNFLAKKNYDAAAPIYETLLQEDFHIQTLGSKLAECYLASGKPEKADTTFINRIYQSRHVTPQALMSLSDTFVKYSRFQEASESLNKALKISPNNRPARIYHARTLCWAGKYDESIKEYKTVLGEKK